MSFNVQSIIIFLLLILPGVTAYAYTRLYVPRPRPPTVLEELAGAIQSTLLIHIVGLTVFALGVAAWSRFVGSLGWDQFVAEGLDGYFKRHPTRTLILGIGYTAYLLLASPTFGALNVANRLSTTFLNLLRLIPVVRRLVPEHLLRDEPVWYAAFQTLRPPTDSVYVQVRMKNKDIYQGRLVTFPILGNEVKNKDFLIDDARYLPEGDENRRQLLNNRVVPGFGGILLNSADVDAIELVYYNPDALAGEPERSAGDTTSAEPLPLPPPEAAAEP